MPRLRRRTSETGKPIYDECRRAAIKPKFFRRLLIGTALSRKDLQSRSMERKIFWIAFTVLGLVADVVLPIWWALGATVPIGYMSWWLAYRSGWFE